MKVFPKLNYIWIYTSYVTWLAHHLCYANLSLAIVHILHATTHDCRFNSDIYWATTEISWKNEYGLQHSKGCHILEHPVKCPVVPLTTTRLNINKFYIPPTQYFCDFTLYVVFINPALGWGNFINVFLVCMYTKFLPTFNYFLEIVYTELHKDHAQVPKTQ